MNVRIKGSVLEIAMEQEDKCIFWRENFTQEFITTLTEKTGKKMVIRDLFLLFEEGLENIEDGAGVVTFDWLSPMDLLFIQEKSTISEATEKEKKESNNKTRDRILVLVVKSASGSTKSLPFPLKQDLNPPADIFRNTIKRLKKYITFLKENPSRANTPP